MLLWIVEDAGERLDVRLFLAIDLGLGLARPARVRQRRDRHDGTAAPRDSGCAMWKDESELSTAVGI